MQKEEEEEEVEREEVLPSDRNLNHGLAPPESKDFGFQPEENNVVDAHGQHPMASSSDAGQGGAAAGQGGTAELTEDELLALLI